MYNANIYSDDCVLEIQFIFFIQFKHPLIPITLNVDKYLYRLDNLCNR